MTLSADGGPYGARYDGYIRTGETEPWVYNQIPIIYGDDGRIIPPDDRDWQLISADTPEGMATFAIEKKVHAAQA